MNPPQRGVPANLTLPSETSFATIKASLQSQNPEWIIQLMIMTPGPHVTQRPPLDATVSEFAVQGQLHIGWLKTGLLAWGDPDLVSDGLQDAPMRLWAPEAPANAPTFMAANDPTTVRLTADMFPTLLACRFT